VNALLKQTDWKRNEGQPAHPAFNPPLFGMGVSRKAEEGSVLLWTVSLCLAITVCVSTLAIAITGQTRTAAMRAIQRQTYTMARGEARKVIVSARLGQLSPGTTTIEYPNGRVEVKVTPGPSSYAVKIAAYVNDATDVISFTFNRVSMTVTDWSDASSGS
jgi:hypothetical protein